MRRMSTGHAPLLLSLLAVDLLAAISPGPNFVVVTQAALRGPFRQATAAVAGILTANLLWCLGVVFGLSALFDLAPWLYGGMKLFGGAYLVYLGVRLWRARAGSAPMPASPVQRGVAAAYARGLLTNLSNPKSVIYFGSIFVLFMAPAYAALERPINRATGAVMMGFGARLMLARECSTIAPS